MGVVSLSQYILILALTALLLVVLVFVIARRAYLRFQMLDHIPQHRDSLLRWQNRHVSRTMRTTIWEQIHSAETTLISRPHPLWFYRWGWINDTSLLAVTPDSIFVPPKPRHAPRDSIQECYAAFVRHLSLLHPALRNVPSMAFLAQSLSALHRLDQDLLRDGVAIFQAAQGHPTSGARSGPTGDEATRFGEVCRDISVQIFEQLSAATRHPMGPYGSPQRRSVVPPGLPATLGASMRAEESSQHGVFADSPLPMPRPRLPPASEPLATPAPIAFALPPAGHEPAALSDLETALASAARMTPSTPGGQAAPLSLFVSAADGDSTQRYPSNSPHIQSADPTAAFLHPQSPTNHANSSVPPAPAPYDLIELQVPLATPSSSPAPSVQHLSQKQWSFAERAEAHACAHKETFPSSVRLNPKVESGNALVSL
ncbi:hypothetical protein PAPYR_807 [Paratrimastix pyriformis]|uniref:Uncharacterized protein n=1 Tax=Paratrimastix pyriformis TaxID=342808 RepID=A0ABQ8UZI3_9EUKA|nr:hypothetical protein PAPYR_807 [Paratrimastix pyriformis]